MGTNFVTEHDVDQLLGKKEKQVSKKTKKIKNNNLTPKFVSDFIIKKLSKVKGLTFTHIEHNTPTKVKFDMASGNNIYIGYYYFVYKNNKYLFRVHMCTDKYVYFYLNGYTAYRADITIMNDYAYNPTTEELEDSITSFIRAIIKNEEFETYYLNRLNKILGSSYVLLNKLKASIRLELDYRVGLEDEPEYSLSLIKDDKDEIVYGIFANPRNYKSKTEHTESNALFVLDITCLDNRVYFRFYDNRVRYNLINMVYDKYQTTAEEFDKYIGNVSECIKSTLGNYNVDYTDIYFYNVKNEVKKVNLENSYYQEDKLSPYFTLSTVAGIYLQALQICISKPIPHLALHIKRNIRFTEDNKKVFEYVLLTPGEVEYLGVEIQERDNDTYSLFIIDKSTNKIFYKSELEEFKSDYTSEEILNIHNTVKRYFKMLIDKKLKVMHLDRGDPGKIPVVNF
ncbi:hypothetical protein ACVWU4_001005 [Campylobacter coli]